MSTRQQNQHGNFVITHLQEIIQHVMVHPNLPPKFPINTFVSRISQTTVYLIKPCVQSDTD